MVSESCDNDTPILLVLYLVDAFAKMLRSVGYNYLVGMFFYGDHRLVSNQDIFNID